jgi:hypothetical protein
LASKLGTAEKHQNNVADLRDFGKRQRRISVLLTPYPAVPFAHSSRASLQAVSTACKEMEMRFYAFASANLNPLSLQF